MASVGSGTDRLLPGWRWIAGAGLVAAVILLTVMLVTRPWRPSAEYRPAAVDVVATITQVGSAWDLGLESGGHVLFTRSVRDLLRPGGNLSPVVGDLMLADSLSTTTWVAFSSGGDDTPGTGCFPIYQEAHVVDDRLVFSSGLSVPIGAWRREPSPSQDVTFAGACLDREGRAVTWTLGPAIIAADPAV